MNNKVDAFVVCTPVYTRNGIYFDVMRRQEKTLNGMPQLLLLSSGEMTPFEIIFWLESDDSLRSRRYRLIGTAMGELSTTTTR